MKDAVMVFGSVFALLSPLLGAEIIGRFTEPIYQKYSIKKSLYSKHETKNLKDEINTILVAVYLAIYLVSLIGLPICSYIFGLSDTTVIIILDIWPIVFSIVFCPFAIKYVK